MVDRARIDRLRPRCSDSISSQSRRAPSLEIASPRSRVPAVRHCRLRRADRHDHARQAAVWHSAPRACVHHGGTGPREPTLRSECHSGAQMSGLLSACELLQSPRPPRPTGLIFFTLRAPSALLPVKLTARGFLEPEGHNEAPSSHHLTWLACCRTGSLDATATTNSKGVCPMRTHTPLGTAFTAIAFAVAVSAVTIIPTSVAASASSSVTISVMTWQPQGPTFATTPQEL